MDTVIGYVVQEAISYLLVDDNEQSDIAANGQFPPLRGEEMQGGAGS